MSGISPACETGVTSHVPVVLDSGIATFSQIAALSGDPIACTLALISLIDALHSLAAAVAFAPHFKDMVPLARGRRWIRVRHVLGAPAATLGLTSWTLDRTANACACRLQRCSPLPWRGSCGARTQL